MPTGGDILNPYAFYDGGFYTLGLTHTRFDRGIGGINPSDFDDDEDDDDKANALIRQSAQGATGSAYRLKTPTKKRPAPQKDKPAIKNIAPLYPPAQTQKPVDEQQEKKDAVKKDPARKEEEKPDLHPDTSWSRTELPKEVDYRLMPEPRRSQMHFKSRARDLVLNEESWGHRKPFLHDNELMFWGSFKTPSLRNVELTGPYMHNGQLQTLEQVIEFYDRGGILQRSADYNPDKHPRIRRMSMTTDDKKALLFFLLCLTDEAVRKHQGPFDNPSLKIPHGYDAADNWKQQWLEIEARGRTGGTAYPSYAQP
jgi:hypothetical protein